jgi:glycosyltransferase involved in cell wall biosynthesis
VVEAQASGCPVIAFRRGGAMETVIEGETGLFFEEQTIESLIKVILSFDKNNFSPIKIKNHANNFSKDKFKKEIKDFVEREYSNFKNN